MNAEIVNYIEMLVVAKARGRGGGPLINRSLVKLWAFIKVLLLRFPNSALFATIFSKNIYGSNLISDLLVKGQVCPTSSERDKVDMKR